jgi:hypothetical protein
VKSAWLRVTSESIIAIDLQRSSYGRIYYLNFRVWVQGLWNRAYTVDDELLRDTGDIFRREPPEFSEALDLESSLDPIARKRRLEELFRSFVSPLSEAFATREGIRAFVRERAEMICLLPAVREQLGIETK